MNPLEAIDNYFRSLAMSDVPQEFLDLLDTAAADLAIAAEADSAYAEAVEVLDEAIDDEEEAKDVALESHQAAHVSATNAINALRDYFRNA